MRLSYACYLLWSRIDARLGLLKHTSLLRYILYKALDVFLVYEGVDYVVFVGVGGNHLLAITDEVPLRFPPRFPSRLLSIFPSRFPAGFTPGSPCVCHMPVIYYGAGLMQD